MTEDEAVRILRKYFEGLFPKVCPNCKRRFATFPEYIETTKRIGRPISYDAELGNWNTAQPIGCVAMANCPCGSTLALGTEGMALPLRLQLLDWVRTEIERRGVSPSELMEHLRDEVRKRALDDGISGEHRDS
jgi:hypothetical protein